MMENAAFVTLSRQIGLRQKMDLIANNLANVDTTGYRGERMLFQEFLAKMDHGEDVSFSQDFGTIRDASFGPLHTTGNVFDLALQTDGYFTIETPNDIQYTRNGRFHTDIEGKLVTADGYPVLDDGGAPIVVDPSAGPIVVQANGTVSDGNGPVGRLAVVSFEDEQKLLPSGMSLYRTEQEPEPVEEPGVVQGMLEGSNVNAILEMTEMINVVRTYQSVASLSEKDGQLRLRAIRQLGRVA